jgi:hypothetical protein
MLLKAGEWRISGSSGVSATVGTPNLKIQVGGSHLTLPLENTITKKKVNLTGLGVGASVGISGMETPLTDWVNTSISTKDMPSDGLGAIYKRTTHKQAYKPEDFTGFMTVISGGASIAATSGEVSMAIWQRYPIEQCMIDGLQKCNIIQTITSTSLMLNLSTLPLATIEAIHAIGFFSGVSATTDLLGAGLNTFSYRMTL